MWDGLKQQIMGLSDAAKVLGVTVPTIRLWFDNGTLGGVRLPGGHRKVFISEVKRLLGATLPKPPAMGDEDPGPTLDVYGTDPLDFLGGD